MLLLILIVILAAAAGVLWTLLEIAFWIALVFFLVGAGAVAAGYAWFRSRSSAGSSGSSAGPGS